ncbi:MAG: YHS domain-containing protein [Candidatus Marinimicrobia bacterium]|nr:YHS domain-containing protein [Candidatus Neomarinimicrobiota bacterium]MCF7830338.1 YHS domain-containing protein [Candidatus Neomarinimicrobiota bacterium]MCF7882407.1 YHS domain-containing protein [Candidatus Neomarinimicrobiota bacterium]
MPRDPVCHMPVPEDDTSYTTAYQGKTYYFCCEHCQESFQNQPGEYISSEEEETT